MDRRHRQVQSLEIDGTVETDPAAMGAKFGTYFKTIILRLRENLPTVSPVLRIVQNGTEAVFKLSSVTKEFVFKQLKAIKINKSTGFADIPARLLKDGAEALSRL